MTTSSDGPGGVELDKVRRATSALIIAPEMDEPVNLVCQDLLRPENPSRSGIIRISYHFSPSEIADRWLERNPGSQASLYCLSITDSSLKDPQTYAENISFASARADDLTGIGMKINQIVGELSADKSDIFVCLDSLDSMLMYTDPRTVYRFIRTISNFLSANNARIHFHIDPSQNDELVNMLRSAVNAIVEIDDSGDITIRTR